MIEFINRESGQLVKEKVYGEKAIHFAYGDAWYQKFLLLCVSKFPLFSALYGLWQKGPWTRGKVKKFITEYHIDESEFLKNQFSSFNDFFIRKLKPEARPLSEGVVIPADGRFLAYQNFDLAKGLFVKGKKFSLQSLLQDGSLAKRYQNGSLIIGRLCPTDYHRFHFPCDGVPSQSKLINGYWYSVNPVALKKNCGIMTQNKRMITELETREYGKVLLVEVGATNVGSINQTFQPRRFVKKGQEKGYFSFGASALVLLFEPNTLQICNDLLQATASGYEMRCLMGQSLEEM